MTILALDTTSELGGVAIRSRGKNIAEISVHAPDGFAHVLFPAISQALSISGLRLDEVDCFAAASGPGSFTGVRVGLSAVKGLAEAMGKPAVGVSNLKALALFGASPYRATILDARRGQFYAAVYDAHLEMVVPEAVIDDYARWLAEMDAPEIEIITNSPPRDLARAVAQVAERMAWQDPAELDANYVRRSDAELFWKDGG